MTLGPKTSADATLRFTMNFRRLALLGAAPLAAFLLVACGDGKDDDPTPSPGSSATAPAGDFGPAPELGGNILKITPAHATKVTQAATRSPNPQRPEGTCAEVSFKDLPDTGRWFRMAFDGAEVTTELTWIVSSNENPTGGIMCYAPEEGFKVGKHQVAVSVQDPNNVQARTKQIVGWSFEVTE